MGFAYFEKINNCIKSKKLLVMLTRTLDLVVLLAGECDCRSSYCLWS